MIEQRKRCTGCGLEYRATTRKPMTEYFWRQSREPDGLRKRCKMCCRELPCMQSRVKGCSSVADRERYTAERKKQATQ